VNQREKSQAGGRSDQAYGGSFGRGRANGGGANRDSGGLNGGEKSFFSRRLPV